jgi:multidrug efflux pump subunit AcrB
VAGRIGNGYHPSGDGCPGKKLQETPWLDYIESETRAGQTVIYINLRDDTPAHKVPAIWYQIRKKMQDIAPSLPEGAQGRA